MQLGRVVAAHNILYDLHDELITAASNGQEGTDEAAQLVAGALIVTEKIIDSTGGAIPIPNTSKSIEPDDSAFLQRYTIR